MPSSSDPRLLSSKALAKALDIENRLNNIIGTSLGPQQPSLLYTSSQTIVTQSANGTYTWTCPAGVTSAKVECWGAGSGAGGGNSAQGGEGGGGGEYAAETVYPVTPGQVYNYVVGAGGTGALGNSGNAGGSGGDTTFDLGGASGGVYAHGSPALGNFSGAPGGTGSTNSTHFDGGAGGSPSAGATGGSGGGSSASPSATGNAGTGATSSTGAAGGAGGTDQGAGGAGGANTAAGNAGGAPGGGGGGAGANAGASFIKEYYPTNSAAYYGPDAIGGNADQQRNSSVSGDGTMWQGGTLAGSGQYSGTMRSLAIWPSSVASDLTGATITKVTLRLLNIHAFNTLNGIYALTGYTGHTSLPSTWDGTGVTGTGKFWVVVNSQPTLDITSSGIGAALKSGSAKALALGASTMPHDEADEYGSFWGAGVGTANPPQLHIEGYTGTAPVQAGSGHDGQVRITYTLPGTIVGAVQPSSGSDDSGNAFAAGYTGPVTAIQPASNPTVVESWHSISLTGAPTGTSGYARVKLLAESNFVMVDIDISFTVLSANGTFTIGTLPSGYYPTVARHVAGGVGGTVTNANPPRLFIPTSGGLQLILPVGASSFGCQGMIALD